MPRAIFKTSIGKVAKIDLENGVVYGCKLALNSVVSTAAEDCGKGIVTNDAMMLKFVELCQGKQVDAFFTHDRFEDASDPIHYDIGFWDNVRRDESGNLIGDLHLCPSEFKDRILWAAENNPGGIMVSPVFEYAEDSEPDKVVPDSVISFDIVKKGAVTSGLFSADNNNNKSKNYTMLNADDKAEIAKMISENGAKIAENCSAKFAEALVKFAKENKEDKEADAKEEAAAKLAEEAEMAEGVTDEDKKPEDEKQPALMRSVIRIGRAQLRKATASIKTQAEAAVVAKLGSSRIVNNTGETGGSNVGAFSAKVDEYFNASKGKINHAKATARVARDFPELYEEHRKSIFRS